jgi:hypothetical protein
VVGVVEVGERRNEVEGRGWMVEEADVVGGGGGGGGGWGGDGDGRLIERVDVEAEEVGGSGGSVAEVKRWRA